MACMARVVGPGFPHHITQRGNRRQQTFFTDDAQLGAKLRRHESTGRPLGDEKCVAQLEAMVGRSLRPRKRGPKPKDNAPDGPGLFG